MYVVATAGHVDHGKSTIVHALTGMEPDRYEEERRRGLTIDLGYAWTRLGTDELAFVDVPGHERFIATMLAGLGPAPAVMFVVAADEGWRQQSSEHLAAIDALGLRHGLLVVTRSDLADPGPAITDARARLAQSSLGAVDAVAVSGLTGDGLDRLRRALCGLVRRLPAPQIDGPVRLWIDRSFVIRGAGTVATSTLGVGRLAIGDELSVHDRRVRVRGLHSLGVPRREVSAVARVAINLRGIESAELRRGDTLLTVGAWRLTSRLDVRLTRPNPFQLPLEPSRPEPVEGHPESSRPLPEPVEGHPEPSRPEPSLSCPEPVDGHRRAIQRLARPELPTHLVAHVGTTAVPVRVRPLGGEIVRLALDRPLPLGPGDRLVLRDPGRHAIVAGAVVLDADPPDLHRRGAAAARAVELRRAAEDPGVRVRERLSRHGALRIDDLDRPDRTALIAAGARTVEGWLIDPDRWQAWRRRLADAVSDHARRNPLDPRLSLDAGRHVLDAPDRSVVAAVAADAGLTSSAGWLVPADAAGFDECTEAGLTALERHLAESPFAAPERPELDAWGLGVRELAAAERVGRIVRLTSDVVLLPTGPATAMRTLATLPQPFTASEARRALGTSRRVVIPLLEHLDRRGWTRRVDPTHRVVRLSARYDVCEV
jgi:selenocysteine-specific elongation factor